MQQPLKPSTLAAYSGVSLPMAAMGMPIAVYLPRFYSEGLGLSLITVGFVFTLARIWDVITDPAMGYLIDRFETRWGRRKHWIALAVPILVISVYQVFIPNPEQVSGGYLLFWLILLYLGYTMMAISHQSWGAELANSYDERTRLFGWREIFVIAGMTIVLALPAILEWSQIDDQTSKVASMGWFCIVLFPLLALPTLFFVPDQQATTRSSLTLKAQFALLVSNQLMWRLLSADFLAGFATAVSGALYIFVASAYFQLPSHASVALLCYFIASFLAMPGWMRLAVRYGKAVVLKVALVYGALINLLLIIFAEPGNAFVLWAFTISYGIAFGAAPTLLRTMMADLTDLDEVSSGEKRAGLFFAMLTTTNKLGAAIAVGLSFAVLEAVVGFQPGQSNSQSALDGLLWTYALGTAGGLLLAALPVMRYSLDRKAHDLIRAELEARALKNQP
ncbi:MAG: MFS transporter [Pseudomonadales bacterium]|jgi:Na+/melibiose symporter-like transporter|nr:MFS transporter [Pseudomonadales bacterium]